MKNIIIYDFDGTLTTNSLPRFEILERSGVKNGLANLKFIKQVIEKSKNKKIDYYQAVYETYFELIKNAGYSLTDKNLVIGYNKIEYNNGVLDLLDMLSKNDINNYLLSSGIKVFLEKTYIAPYFKDIYATTFTYNENKEVTGVDFLMSDKNKVLAIKDILKKNGYSIDDCSNVIYVGDGLTDYYAMKYVKEHNGTSILVYNNQNSKELISSKQRSVVNIYSDTDFTQNGDLNRQIKSLCKIKN